VRVEPFQFDARVCGCELPVYLGMLPVADSLPCLDFLLQRTVRRFLMMRNRDGSRSWPTFRRISMYLELWRERSIVGSLERNKLAHLTFSSNQNAEGASGGR